MEDLRKYEPFFGTWYLGKKLGEGSFGKVYEIEKRGISVGEPSALKIISIPKDREEVDAKLAEGTDLKSISKYFDSVLEELTREIEIMSSLKGNTNIVSLEDYDVIRHEDGIGYDLLLKMELLTPLKRQMSGLSEKEIVKIGIDICKALELCHSRNILHRDIKPSNIFISKNGDYKLGDFGIARTMEKTHSGLSKKGTFNYMAPEIYRGEPDYDNTVDIYSLGLVLYTLLNGNRMPFLPPAPQRYTLGDEQNALGRRYRGEPLPRLQVRAGLDAIVRKACAFDPAVRYPAAVLMRRDLEEYYKVWFGEEAAGLVPEETREPLDPEATFAMPHISGEYYAGSYEETVPLAVGSSGSSYYNDTPTPGSSGSSRGRRQTRHHPRVDETAEAGLTPAPQYIPSSQNTGSSAGTYDSTGSYGSSDTYTGAYTGGGPPESNKWKYIAIAAGIVLAAVIAVTGIILAGGGSGPADTSGGETTSEVTEGGGSSQPTDTGGKDEPETESEPDPDPEPVFPEGTLEFNGHHYKVYNDPMTWQDAKAKCESVDGHLATVNDAQEQLTIVSVIEQDGVNKQHYWLGGTDEGHEGTWEWITGEPFTYSNWKKDPNDPGNANNNNQPNNSKFSKRPDGSPGQDYLEIQTTRPPGEEYEYMTWNDTGYDGVQEHYMGEPQYCSTKYFGYICEWDY